MKKSRDGNAEPKEPRPKASIAGGDKTILAASCRRKTEAEKQNVLHLAPVYLYGTEFWHKLPFYPCSNPRENA